MILDRESLVRDTAGHASWLQTTKVPLRNTEGKVIGLIGVNRDVTARRQAEEEIRAANEALQRTLAKLQASHEQLKGMQLQLIEAEKMKSVGRLAAGVAHEVKNPLAIIGLGIGYVSRTVAKDDPNLAAVIDADARRHRPGRAGDPRAARFRRPAATGVAARRTCWRSSSRRWCWCGTSWRRAG